LRWLCQEISDAGRRAQALACTAACPATQLAAIYRYVQQLRCTARNRVALPTCKI